MAKRFVRVELSDSARDFRPVAIEPGLPVLDRAGANARLLFKWLGGLVVAPEWDRDSVSFFVQDDHGGRLEDIVCQPVGDEDLQGILKEDLALLRERLGKAKAESPSERIVLQKIRDDFAALVDDPARLDRDSFFFRYRDPQHRWRLVWCPGYQRRDAQAAPAVICTDPDCNLLFVRRPGGSARCPGCRGTPLLAQAAPKRRGCFHFVLLLLVLITLVALLVPRLFPRLTVTPEHLEIAVGDTADLTIESSSAREPIQVTSSDRAVVDVIGPPHRLKALSAGAAQVEVRQGKLTRFVRVQVKAGASEASAAPPGTPLVPEAKAVDAGKTGDTRGKPVEVVIATDQGQPVHFPVGAEFSDFRVEARYADGFTRIVTKKATLRTPDEPSKSPVSFSGGRMQGIRPGKTSVAAEFAGVATKKGLDVEVSASADVDEIRLTPSPASISPGENLTLEATGYKGGKSMGAITGLGGLAWKSSDAATVRVEGPAATGVRLGQATVTAQLGSLASRPAEIRVVPSIAEALKVEPGLFRIRVGESLRVGEDVSVSRGGVDVSDRCTVTSSADKLVRYAPETRSLVGVAPGAAAVRFAVGDKIASAVVEVVDEPLGEGQTIIEPAVATLSPGQAVDLRVFLVTKDGVRIDRTGAATLASSVPEKVQVSGDWACALAPGTADVTATLPESKAPGRAAITVDNEAITGILVDPSHLDLAPGDRARLKVLGRSVSGVHELFPQDRLKMSPGGANPGAIRIVGSQHVDAVSPGSATVEVAWANKFRREASVTVSGAAWSGLAIDPAAATIHPGQQLAYTVTGVRGGQRRVISPDDGLKLSVTDPSVATAVAGGAVLGNTAGRTSVVAQVGSERAEAVLNVVPGSGPSGVVIDTPGPGLIIRNPDGAAYVVGPRGVVEPGWDSTWHVGPSVVPSEVAVTPGETLSIEPPRAALAVGETTPRFSVMAQASGGSPRGVAAAVESMNPEVLAAASGQPGRFLARKMGSTQVRATAGDRVLYADVTVTGARFDAIRTTIASPTDKDFGVRAEITAAGSEGPLEYRVYRAGQTPPAVWTPAKVEGNRRRVVVESPRIATGPPSTFYTLTFEARDPATGTVQQYPFTFRLAPQIERAEK